METKIIAELGINHNGDVDIAKAMVTKAAIAGCDYVKLQKRDVEWCYTPEQLAQPCDSPWGETIEDKVCGRELDWDAVEFLDRHCSSLDIGWSASCFDLNSLSELEGLFPQRPFNKVASAMALHQLFLREVARYGRLTLLSTGLLTDEGISRAAQVFENARCPYVIMHTTALYPAPLERLNLSVISILQEVFHEAEHCMGIGYSGHEVGVLPSVVAAGLGATWIERHFTLDRSMYGADQSASLEPAGLERLVRDIRSLPVIRGDGNRVLHGDEKNPVTYFRVG